MLQWLKVKLSTMFHGKKDDFKRDGEGHALANRYDVDNRPNEPDDGLSPPIRMPENPEEREKAWELLKDTGIKSLDSHGPLRDPPSERPDQPG